MTYAYLVVSLHIIQYVKEERAAMAVAILSLHPMAC